jgi:hypothetical protein
MAVIEDHSSGFLTVPEGLEVAFHASLAAEGRILQLLAEGAVGGRAGDEFIAVGVKDHDLDSGQEMKILQQCVQFFGVQVCEHEKTPFCGWMIISAVLLWEQYTADGKNGKYI